MLCLVKRAGQFGDDRLQRRKGHVGIMGLDFLQRHTLPKEVKDSGYRDTCTNNDRHAPKNLRIGVNVLCHTISVLYIWYTVNR